MSVNPTGFSVDSSGIIQPTRIPISWTPGANWTSSEWDDFPYRIIHYISENEASAQMSASSYLLGAYEITTDASGICHAFVVYADGSGNPLQPNTTYYIALQATALNSSISEPITVTTPLKATYDSEPLSGQNDSSFTYTNITNNKQYKVHVFTELDTITVPANPIASVVTMYVIGAGGNGGNNIYGAAGGGGGGGSGGQYIMVNQSILPGSIINIQIGAASTSIVNSSGFYYEGLKGVDANNSTGGLLVEDSSGYRSGGDGGVTNNAGSNGNNGINLFFDSSHTYFICAGGGGAGGFNGAGGNGGGGGGTGGLSNSAGGGGGGGGSGGGYSGSNGQNSNSDGNGANGGNGIFGGGGGGASLLTTGDNNGLAGTSLGAVFILYQLVDIDTTPSTPQIISATAFIDGNQNNSIDVVWTYAGPLLSEINPYQVNMHQSNSSGSAILSSYPILKADVNASEQQPNTYTTVLEFRDSSGNPFVSGETYYFTLEALGLGDIEKSAMSSPIQTVTFHSTTAPPPSDPTNLSAITLDIQATRIPIRWTYSEVELYTLGATPFQVNMYADQLDISGAPPSSSYFLNSYEVSAPDASGFCHALIQYADSSRNPLLANTQYFFELRAYDGTNFSGDSERISATTTAPPPSDPTNLSAITVDIQATRIPIRWTYSEVELYTLGATPFQVNMYADLVAESAPSSSYFLNSYEVSAPDASGFCHALIQYADSSRNPLLANTQYFFGLRAYNGTEFSDSSGTRISATTVKYSNKQTTSFTTNNSGSETFTYADSSGIIYKVHKLTQAGELTIPPNPTASVVEMWIVGPGGNGGSGGDQNAGGGGGGGQLIMTKQAILPNDNIVIQIYSTRTWVNCAHGSWQNSSGYVAYKGMDASGSTAGSGWDASGNTSGGTTPGSGITLNFGTGHTYSVSAGGSNGGNQTTNAGGGIGGGAGASSSSGNDATASGGGGSGGSNGYNGGNGSLGGGGGGGGGSGGLGCVFIRYRTTAPVGLVASKEDTTSSSIRLTSSNITEAEFTTYDPQIRVNIRKGSADYTNFSVPTPSLDSSNNYVFNIDSSNTTIDPLIRHWLYLNLNGSYVSENQIISDPSDIVNVVTAPANFTYNSSGVTATTIPLSWSDENGNATGFNIYYSGTNSSGSITNASGTSYSLTGLQAGTQYTIQLAGIVYGEESARAGPLSVTTAQGTATVSAPASLTLSGASTHKSITLGWGYGSNPHSFTLYIDGSGSVILLGTIRTYTVESLRSDTSYTFSITATIDGVESQPSDTLTESTLQAPAPTINSSGVSVTPYTITVPWTYDQADESSIDGFKIVYGPDGGSNTIITINNPTIRLRTLTDLSPDTEYVIYVTAYIGSAQSGNDSIHIPLFTAKYPTPTYLSEVGATTDSIDVSWYYDASNNPASFDIEVVDSSGTLGPITINIAEGTDRTATLNDTGIIIPGIQYDIKISAIDSSGFESDQSTAIQGATLPLAPSNLDEIYYTKTANSITLQWNHESNATEFVVYYTNSSGDSSGSTAPFPKVEANIFNNEITDLLPATSYIFTMRAFANNKQSALSDSKTISTKAATPDNLVAPFATSNSLTVSWTYDTNPDFFTINYTSGDSSGSVNSSGTMREAVITGLQPDTDYTISITATVSDIESEPISQAFVTVPAAPTLADEGVMNPVDPQSTNSSTNSISWNVPANTTYTYKLYYTSSNSSGTRENVSLDAYPALYNPGLYSLDTAFSLGRRYTFRVTATKGGSESDFSNSVTILMRPDNGSFFFNSPTSITVSCDTQNDYASVRIGYFEVVNGVVSGTFIQTSPIQNPPPYIVQLDASGNFKDASENYTFFLSGIDSSGLQSIYEGPITEIAGPTTPAAPTNLEVDPASSISATQIPIRWQYDSSGLSPTTPFQVNLCNSSGTIQQSYFLNSSGFTVDSSGLYHADVEYRDSSENPLLPNTTYYITLRAYDDSTFSVQSNLLQATTSASSGPVVPIGFAEVTNSATPVSLTLSWEYATNPDLFTINYTTSDSSGSVNASGTLRQREVTGLQSGKEYTFTISATVSGVKSVDSSNVVIATLPLPPTDLIEVDDTKTLNSITFQWTHTSNAEDFIVYYTNSSGDSSGSTEAFSKANGNIKEITGLLPATSYTFRVRAFAYSRQSALSEPVTISTEPNSPSGITLVTRTIDSLTIQWSYNYPDPDLFTIYYTPVGSTDTSFVNSSGTILNKVITGLEGDTRYTIYITATVSGIQSTDTSFEEFFTKPFIPSDFYDDSHGPTVPQSANGETLVEIALYWNYPGNTLPDEYKLYYEVDGNTQSTFSPIANYIRSPSTSTFTPGKRHTINVTAMRNTIESDQSDPVTILMPPGNATYFFNSPTSITVSCDTPNDYVSVRIGYYELLNGDVTGIFIETSPIQNPPPYIVELDASGNFKDASGNSRFYLSGIDSSGLQSIYEGPITEIAGPTGPAAPTSLEVDPASSISATQIPIRWQYDSSGLSPTTPFQVNLCNSSGTIQNSYFLNSSGFTVDSSGFYHADVEYRDSSENPLLPNTTYYITLRAYDDSTFSVQSNLLQATTSASSGPVAPTKLGEVANTATPVSLTLSWQYTTNPDFFTINYTTSDSSGSVNSSGTLRQRQVTGLESGKQYTFTISATVSGVESDDSTPQLVIATLPDAPLNLADDSVGGDEATPADNKLTWDNPDVTYTKFILYYESSDSSGTVDNISENKYILPTEVFTLGKQYTFRVSVVANGRESAKSYPLDLLMRPGNFRFVSGTPETLTVAWDTQNDYASLSLLYRKQGTSTEQSTEQSVGNITTSPHMLTGLDSSGLYTLFILGVNSSGDISVYTDPITMVSPPTDLRLDVSGILGILTATRIPITWVPGADTPISTQDYMVTFYTNDIFTQARSSYLLNSYEIYSDSSGSYAYLISSDRSGTPLFPNTTYYFTIKANGPTTLSQESPGMSETTVGLLDQQTEDIFVPTFPTDSTFTYYDASNNVGYKVTKYSNFVNEILVYDVYDNYTANIATLYFASAGGAGGIDSSGGGGGAGGEFLNPSVPLRYGLRATTSSGTDILVEGVSSQASFSYISRSGASAVGAVGGVNEWDSSGYTSGGDYNINGGPGTTVQLGPYTYSFGAGGGGAPGGDGGGVGGGGQDASGNGIPASQYGGGGGGGILGSAIGELGGGGGGSILDYSGIIQYPILFIKYITSAPLGISTGTVTPTSITISWLPYNAAQTVDKYIIWIASQSDDEFTRFTSIVGLTYTDFTIDASGIQIDASGNNTYTISQDASGNPLVPGTDYYIYIQASVESQYGYYITSDYSDVITATITIDPPTNLEVDPAYEILAWKIPVRWQYNSSSLSPTNPFKVNLCNSSGIIQESYFLNSSGFTVDINGYYHADVEYRDSSKNPLLPNTTYYITLQASGSSVQSNLLQATTANTNNAICFLRGTKILCLTNDFKEQYIEIEKIRPGTIVKTLNKVYVKVKHIGKMMFENPDHSKRCLKRLYRLPRCNYPELKEDLIITGNHSILVDTLSKEEEKMTLDLAKRIYITTNKYRLMAHVDQRAEPYINPGSHEVWHLALENNNYICNYGVYANGLPTETCSLRMILEYSGMELQR
jgi:hypothetical protein